MELSDRIDALLADERADRASVEGALADGYARVLVLEAEKLRLERRLLALARTLGHTGAKPEGTLEEAAGRVSGLALRLAGTTAELGELRGRLADLRRRAGGVRAA